METKNLTELINIVREKAKIEDVIGDYVQIIRKGNSFQGLCPFHDDQSPSMSVSPSKGIFKCFSCGAGGNVISFVQNHEGISFIETLKNLANKYEINWKEYISEKKIKPINPEILEIRKANQEAQNFYKYQIENELRNPTSNITEYLKERNLSKVDILKFDLGYASTGNRLVKFMLKKGFEESTLIKAGLAKNTTNGLRDYFINRLLFSLADGNGNIIGFSGRRITNDKNIPKYLNTAETKDFKKGEFLYNFHRARSPISLKKKIIIVEGYMDVISFSKIGVENVVATMGTSFTVNQLKIITEATKHVTLAMDTDTAGINATIATGKLLYNKGIFNLNVFMNTKEKDIDELINNNDSQVVFEILKKSEVTFEEFYKKLIISQNQPNFKAIRSFLKLIAKKGKGMEASVHMREISESFNIDFIEIKKNYDELMKTFHNVDNKKEITRKTPQYIEPVMGDIYFKDIEEQIFIEPSGDLSEESLKGDEYFMISLASYNGVLWRGFKNSGYKFHTSEANDIYWALTKFYHSRNVIEKNSEKIIKLITTPKVKEIAQAILNHKHDTDDLQLIKKRLEEYRRKSEETFSRIKDKMMKETSKTFTLDERIQLLRSKQKK